MEDRDKILDYTKPVRLPDDCSKNRKNFTQGYYYREIGRYKNVVPSEFQWAAEDKLINKTTYEELKCQLPDSPRSTFLMVFSPDGKKVASTHGNHNVYVTDLTTGKNIQTLSGHPRTPWCIAFHPSSNQILASGCLGGQVRVWDLHGGSEVWTAESQTVIASLAFHPIDRMLVIATYNELHFWDWSQPEPFAKCSTKSGREKVRYVSFDRLGNKLITGIANPVNAPSQWDRINVVSSQTPMISTTSATSTSSTTFNSTPPTTVASQSSNDQGRSITSLYRNSINYYNQIVSIARNTPMIDRGTDPLDLLDLRNNRNNNSEGSTSNPSPSTSNPQVNPSSPLRFKITRSACRSYRPLSSRERFRIHSSVFRRLSSRSSHLLNSTVSNTTASHSSVFTNPSISSPLVPVSRDTYIPRLRRCAFSLGPTARSWSLTLSPENSSNLFSSRGTTQSSTSGAVTNPTFTSYSDRGIFSTRESSSNSSDRTEFSVVRPYRLLFDDSDGRTSSQRDTQSEPERELEESSTNLSNSVQSGSQRHARANFTSNSSEATISSNRDIRIHSPETEIERELQRSTSGLRRQEAESTESNRESAHNSEPFRNNRSSILELIPVNLRNISPVRRFRDDTNSDGELAENSSRENHSMPQSLMHPRPVPRFQLRTRYLQDQRSQLHLLTNRETHGLNLQNNQSLRRQLSFRPGGQFVLSRHSNSPFQPRVPHSDSLSQTTNSSGSMKQNSESRFEIPSQMSSFNSSASNTAEAGASSSTGSHLSQNSVASNLSFTGEASHQLPDQINRRLFDRVKMMLRDRIRNSLENASTDSTVNYSRISGESEAERDPLDCEENVATRGLGPRGADPMLSSVSENLDSTNELLHNSGSSSPVSANVNGASSSNNSLNIAQSDLLDPWEGETDTTPLSISAPLPMNDVFNEQPQDSTHIETNVSEQNQTSLTSNNGAIDNSNPSSPEFSMRQGIQLLSLHIENMQRLCWARIEILQLQKIRKMWEDLTNQIRQFHNIIQNRTLGENSSNSGLNDASNSVGDIPSIRNLAISSSPIPERNPECTTSSETSNDASTSYGRNNYRELVETNVNDLLTERQQSSSNIPPSNPFEKFKSSSSENIMSRNLESSNSSDNKPLKSETEEPQPGPSGLSAPSTSGGVRNSILQLEYRVYRLLRDIIQKTRRRREARELGMGTTGGFPRHSQPSGVRSSLRSKSRSHRSCRLDSSAYRSKALSKELEAIWQTWKTENPSSRASQPVRPRGNSDGNEPSTSTAKSSTSGDACQSCGQKKKPVKEYWRQKRRSMDSPSGAGSSGSASKILKNNVGERSEAPSTSQERNATTSSSQGHDNSTNDLLKQMLQTMETMLHFQREAFRSTKDGARDRSPRPSLSAASSDDDSDGDHNDSSEQREMFFGSTPRRGARESLVNSMQDIAQLRAKKLLGFMVKSLNQFFGKNFRNLNQVLDEQIFSLYMLLDLALELTDLLLEQLNARSRDLEQNWGVNNSGETERNWTLPRTAGLAERTRERNRRPYIPFFSTSREDPKTRFSTNPFLRSHTGLISNRRNSSGTPTTIHERFSSVLPSSCRRKRTTARMSTSSLPRWYYRRGRTLSQASSSSSSPATPGRLVGSNSLGSRYRNFCSDRRHSGDGTFGMRASSFEVNNNSNNNDTNNNYSPNEIIQERNNNRSGNNSNDNSNNNSFNSNFGSSTNVDNRSTIGASGSSDSSSNNNNNNSNNNNNNNNNNNSLLNYYFPSSSNSSSNNENGNNIIIVTGLSSSSDNRNNPNNASQNGSNVSFLNQNSLPPLRSMELTLSRNESGDLSLRDERPIFWIRYGGNSETSGSLNSGDSQSRVSGFTVPIVQVNDVPVPDVSMLNQPRHRPQSPVPRVSEDIWRWRAWRPRFLHPRHGGPNPFDDQDSNDVPENIHYYRILSTSAGSHLGVYTFDPMIITDAPMSPHHRIQAWDFSKMNIPDISDREANGVVPECKIHNDASVDVSNDGHLLVTLLPSGRLSVTTMLGVYSLDWCSLGQLLYRTSFEQNAVSVSLSPTNRHLLVGLASRPVVLRDRTNMAQIFRLEGGRPSPHGGSWQSGRGRLVHMRDLEQTREMNIINLNCIRWAPGAGQGLVYGTNTGQLTVLR